MQAVVCDYDEVSRRYALTNKHTQMYLMIGLNRVIIILMKLVGWTIYAFLIFFLYLGGGGGGEGEYSSLGVNIIALLVAIH